MRIIGIAGTGGAGFSADPQISAGPENETTMFTYCTKASLPMQLDRQPVEVKGARAEGA